MRSIAKLHQHLSAAGHSRTVARDLVFLALDESGPCTRRDLARQLSGQIDSSSVYRTINLFINIGISNMIRFHLIELSDRFKQHHHHFVCNVCGRETGFHDNRLELLIGQLAAARQLVLTDHQVELSGVCQSCSVGLKSSSTSPVS